MFTFNKPDLHSCGIDSTMKESNQPGPSTSACGTRLPPVVEWLTFTMKQLKTTSNIFIKEIEGVLAEWVDNNLDELLKEEYQASKITERVVKEFHQITAKTIQTLKEQDRQTKIELKERFPWIDKRVGNHDDDDDDDIKSSDNGGSTANKNSEQAVPIEGISDGINSEEFDHLDTSDRISSKRKGKSNSELKSGEGKQVDEPPHVVSSKKNSGMKKSKVSTNEVPTDELTDATRTLPSSRIQADEDDNSDSSSSDGKIKSGKRSTEKENESDSSDSDGVTLNESVDAETEESNDEALGELNTSTSDKEKQQEKIRVRTDQARDDKSEEESGNNDGEHQDDEQSDQVEQKSQRGSDDEDDNNSQEESDTAHKDQDEEYANAEDNKDKKKETPVNKGEASQTTNDDTCESQDIFSDDDGLADAVSPVAVSDNDDDSESDSVLSPEIKKKNNGSDSLTCADVRSLGSPKRSRTSRQSAARAAVMSITDSPSPVKAAEKKSSKVTAPFKQPKKMADIHEPKPKKGLKELIEDLGSDPEKCSDDEKATKNFKNPITKPKAANAVSEGDSSDFESELAWRNDYKLDPKCSYVAMETLPDIVHERLQTHKFVAWNQNDKATDKKKTRGRPRLKEDVDDPLTKALKKLASFSPYVRESKKRSQSTTTSVGKAKTKGSRAKETDDLVRDDQTTEESSDDEPVLKRNIEPIIPEKLKSQDSDVELVNSDDEELDGPGYSSDEGIARKNVLKNARGVKKELLSDAEDKDTKPGEKRKKGGSYYTPNVCKIPEPADSNSSDDDDFITKKRKLTRGKKAVINSESEENSSDNRNKKSNYVELSSDSEVSESDRNTRSRKKKRRVSSSDSDYQKKKKRKRIRNVSDSDDDSKRKGKGKNRRKKGSDIEILSGSDSDIQEIAEDAGKGRKNIRGIMNKKDLQRETRRAEEEEEKRKKRLIEKQAQFNELFSAPVTEVLEQLVLDYDPQSKEPLVSVDPSIVKKLKPHQAQGITFMYNACFESVEQFKKPNNEGSGCILAHCMGLGKTLQTIAFVHSVMTSDLLHIKSVLIMCPLNTVGNWNNELRMWLREADKRISVHKLYDEKNVPNRVQALQTWKRRGGVGIMHYDAFRGLVQGKRIKKNYQQIIMECLLDPGPDVVICDEGHVFKNDRSKISLAVNKLRTKRRVVLTGTPLQNNLLEYHCMMQFVKPNLLGSKKEFSNRFVNPITNGQHKDSTSYDVSIMKKRAHVLHKLLDGCVQRLDYSVLLPFLPPKYEYVVLINMTEIQKTLYVHYLNSIKEQKSVQELIKGGLLLKHAANLAKVWCHPYALVLKHNEKTAVSSGSESMGSLQDFIDDRSEDTSESGSDIDWLDEHDQVLKKDKQKEDAALKIEGDDNSNPIPDKDELSGDIIQEGGDWWSKFFKSKGEIQMLEHSNKMMVLLDIIKTCEGIQDKVLVFSQYLYSLNMIEEFLELLDEEAKKTDSQDSFPVFPKVSDYSQRWRKNIEYFRIDGSTKSEDRQKNCDMFNKTDTSRAKLFLISTKAGGLGINLVGANRVVIFDASWNPSQDMQSIFRVYRFGQNKPCYIYRLLAKGTIEEKIYNRQVVKLSLSGRVVDEHQIERHFTFDDMAKMYEFDPDEKADRPIPPVPKDRLLADLLMTHKGVIDTYLEHDSLLQNQAGEELSEEERKTAWDEYQNEKNNLRMNMNMNNINAGMINTAFHSMMISANQVEVEQAYNKMKGKIREMYPDLSPDDFQVYTHKVKKEVDHLRQLTYQYHENHIAFTDSLKKKWIDLLQTKKRQIQTYFSVPGALAMEMNKEGFIPVNNPNVVQGVNSTSQPVNGGPISVVPLSNILEQPTYVPGHAGLNQSLFLNQNHVRNMATYRPSILNRPRITIPTTTVPYNPSSNQPSTSFRYHGPSPMN